MRRGIERLCRHIPVAVRLRTCERTCCVDLLRERSYQQWGTHRCPGIPNFQLAYPNAKKQLRLCRLVLRRACTVIELHDNSDISQSKSESSLFPVNTAPPTGRLMWRCSCLLECQRERRSMSLLLTAIMHPADSDSMNFFSTVKRSTGRGTRITEQRHRQRHTHHRAPAQAPASARASYRTGTGTRIREHRHRHRHRHREPRRSTAHEGRAAAARATHTHTHIVHPRTARVSACGRCGGDGGASVMPSG